MVVQSHQVKVLQARPGLAWVRCEQLGGGVISTESQTVEALATMQALVGLCYYLQSPTQGCLEG